MSEPSQQAKPGTGRTQLLLIAAVFFGPLLVAAWLYYGGTALQPEGRANHGALLEPIINIADAAPGSALHAANEGHWLLIYMHEGECAQPCEYGLYSLRQMRLMLGREMDRVTRVFLHGDSPPDTVDTAVEHAGLITLQDEQLTQALADKKPAELAAGGYYLVDPLGNLVMYFHPELEPGEVVDDIKRLLKLSRIG